MKRKAFLIVSLCTALAGCGSEAEPGVYALPMNEVYQRLANNPLDALRLKRGCGILIHLMPSARNGNEIDWRVTHNGNTTLQFSVKLEEVEPGQTKVNLSIDSKDPDGGEFYDGDYFTPYPALAQPIRPAIREAIAATLEGREYDTSKAPRSADDDVCDVQRATLQSRGVPIDVVMERHNGTASTAFGEDDDWGSGPSF